MKLKNAHLTLPGSDADAAPRRVENTRLWGIPLIFVQMGWVVLALLALVTFVISVPIYNAQLQTPCSAEDSETCWLGRQLPTQQIPVLEANGFSLETYANYVSAVRVLAEVVTLGIALIIFRRKSDEWIALLVSVRLVLTNTLDPVVAPTWARLHPALRLLDVVLYGLAAASFICFLYLFPDGRFAPRWTRWVLAVYLLAVLQFFAAAAVAPDLNHMSAILAHPVAGLFVWGGTLFTGIGSQIYRYWRVSDPTQRQQTKWVVSAIVLFFVLTSPTVLPLEWNEPGALGFLINITANSLFTPMIAIAIAIAVFRYRLWDIDPIINRALVYGTLTALIVGIYVLIVGYLGALFQTSGNRWISLIATGIVAVLFQPLRDRLQRGVNRLMYGQRDEPYAVISQLGRRLEATLAPDAVLPAIVETVREALKLPYVAVALTTNDERASGVDAFEVVAASGTPPVHLVTQSPAHLVTLPLTYQHETVGQLLLAPRSPGEPFSPADRRLLDDLARQAGVAVHAVRLTSDLQRANEELQRARIDLVTAREEERRRLRRDLHDGLGSVLASLNLRAGAIRTLLTRDPSAADALAVEQQSTIRSAIADVRRLVHQLRPPALDELGFTAAIREQAARYQGEHTGSPLRVSIDMPEALPPLPAAVEVAAYRIVQEALTNVVRHAQASRCRVRIAVHDGQLQVEISDDGVGLPEGYRAGVGVLSMRERAEELGGRFSIETLAAGGTCVRAWLPLGGAIPET